MNDLPNSATFVAPDPQELGSLFPGYEIHHLIAVGGMGAVYRAEHKSLQRPVALKILPIEFSEDKEFCASFEAEARAMARLNHANLIGLYDFGEVNGMLFIVMEFVPGKSLFHSAHRKAIDPSYVIRLVTSVCSGLAHAHENGIIHRDIKPSNILLNANAEPKIGDFGLAHPIERKFNVGETIFGTPGYTAPEVVDAPLAVDHRADLFSIGVLLHELLTGKLPSEDARPASILCGCDLRFDAIIRRATSPAPSARYSSATEIARELQAITTPVPAKVAHVPARRQEPTGAAPVSKKKSHIWLVYALFLVALIGYAVFRIGSGHSAEKSPLATTEIPSVPEAKPAPPGPDNAARSVDGGGQEKVQADEPVHRIADRQPDAPPPAKGLTSATPPIPGNPLSPFDRAYDSLASTSNPSKISQFDGLFRELHSNAGYGFHVDEVDGAFGIQYGETKSTSLILGKRIGNAIHADWIQAVTGSRHVFTYTLTSEGNLDMDGDWNDNGVQRHHHQILYRITDAATFQRDLSVAAGKASTEAVTALTVTLAKQGPRTRPLATRPGPILGLEYGLFVKQTPENWVSGKDGTPAGAPGTGRMVDAFRLKGVPFPAEFRIYTAARGWLAWTPCDGTFATAGVRKLEAIQFSFPGGIPDGIQFYGRVCCGGVGWLRTVKIENLLVLGATDLELSIEGIQLSLREGEQGNSDDLVKQADERFNTFSPPGSAPIPTAVASLNQEPGIGRWYFDNNSRDPFKLLPDGVLMQNGRSGSWSCLNSGKSPRIYQLSWDSGRAIDTMTMNWDGTLMTGHGKDGNLHLIASRVDGSDQLRQGQHFASTDGGKMTPAGSSPQTADSKSSTSPTLKPTQPNTPISEGIAAAKADLDKMLSQMTSFRSAENAKLLMKIQNYRRSTAENLRTNASALALDLMRSDPAKPWITADDLVNRESKPLLIVKWRYFRNNEIRFMTDGTIMGIPNSRWRKIYFNACFAASGPGWADLICLDANGGQVVNRDGFRFRMTQSEAVVPPPRVIPQTVWSLYSAEEKLRTATKEAIQKKANAVTQWAESKSKGLPGANEFLASTRQSLREDLEDVAEAPVSPEMLRYPAGQWESKEGKMSFSQGGRLFLSNFRGEWFWVGDQAVAIVITKGRRTSVGICSVPGRDPLKLNIHTVMGENIGDAQIIGHKPPNPPITTPNVHP